MDAINVSTVVNQTLNATAESIPFSGMFLSSAALFILAILPIYFGSFRSQQCCSEEAELEVITARDAATFPAYASAALFGIYLLFKFVPKEYINLLVNLHLSFIGIGCMCHVLRPALSRFFPSCVKNYLFKAEFTKSQETVADGNSQWKTVASSTVRLESKEIGGVIVSVLIGVIYFFTRHWIPNNFLAVCLSVVAIEYIRLNKFINGFLLLGGLFFYDIFWVFGTPVMVTVAKALDAPIKVTFPRDFLTHGIFGKQLGLLGLGDIVIPGVFVALLLRFDHKLNRSGSLIYFYTGYVAYMVGLLITFIVMFTFNAAQPALLYLVPTCLGFPSLLAWIQGDLAAMFAYEDIPEKTEKKDQ